MIEQIKNYFHFNEKNDLYLYGFVLTGFWIFDMTSDNLGWVFLIPVLYCAYSTSKIFISMAVLSLFVTSVIGFQNRNSIYYLYLLITYICFFRDMYFLFKYQTNLLFNIHHGSKMNTVGRNRFLIGLLMVSILSVVVFVISLI